MLIPLHLFPQDTIDQYKLQENAQNGQVYLGVRKAIYGIPQAGALSNKKLKKFLAPDGYYEVAHTPGLWRHATRTIQFSLPHVVCLRILHLNRIPLGRTGWFLLRGAIVLGCVRPHNSHLGLETSLVSC